MTSRPRQTVSVPLAMSPSLCHFVSMPHTLISAITIFIFCLPFPNQPKIKKIFSLHSRLRNSLKNNLIDKFEILFHPIDPKFFFVKSIHKAGIRKRRPL